MTAQPLVVKFVFVLYLQLLIWNTYTACIHSQATLTTNKRCYATNEAIQMSWDYRSRYTDTGQRNDDVIAIFLDETIPTRENTGFETQMFVYVGTLTKDPSRTIRNSGSVVFDGNPPIETSAQAWSLQEGYYKSYLYDISTGTIYASTATYVVGTSTCILASKTKYQYNEPISVYWNYLSIYTPIIPWLTFTNYDSVAIYYSNQKKPENWIMMVAVSTLTQNYSTTIRNNGVVTFDGNSPNETGSQKWPLEVGGVYEVRIVDLTRKFNYVISKTFTVLAPPTISPTKTPTTAPTKSPTTAPTKASTKIPSKTPTTAPTKIPSKTPTTAPTNAPTKTPSKMPTKAPTTTPTKTPTTAPTEAPTTTPTKTQTNTPIGAILTTDKRCYAKNKAIRLSWRYRSRYTNTGDTNEDVISIFYSQTIPTFENQGKDSRLLVYVSTLNEIASYSNITIRNIGSVVFDGNLPEEKWPLNEGYYISYILDSVTGTIYTSSEAFVIGTCIQPSKTTYQYNEPILIHWNYLSNYTTPILAPNYDYVAIYTFNEVDPENWIMLVAVSTLTQNYSTTIRNNGLVIFDGNSPNETGSQKWPLQVGVVYTVRIVDIPKKFTYVTSDTFTVLPPPTNSPSKTPTKAPTSAPTRAPSNAPLNAPTTSPLRRRTCGLFGLGLFCPLTFCGFFGRLILGNRNC